MDKSLQTRIIDFKHLCYTNLINDIKEAATCEVRSVCRLACHQCPYVLECIDVEKIKLTGLSAYTIQLKKAKDGQLLIFITVLDIENWLITNSLPFITAPILTDGVAPVAPSKSKRPTMSNL